MNPDQLRQLDDETILNGLDRLVKCENETGAGIVAHLIVVEERKLYVPLGYSSLWTYLTESKKHSSGVAQRRKLAVAAAMEFPEIWERLRDERLNLCAVALLAPVLTKENVTDVLRRAEGMSTRKVEELANEIRFAPKARTDEVEVGFTFSAGSDASETATAEPARAAMPPPAQKKKRTVARQVAANEVRMHVSMSKQTKALYERLKELAPGVEDDALLAKAFGALLDEIDPLRRHARREAKKAARVARRPAAKRKPSTQTKVATDARRPTRAVSDQVSFESGGRCTFICKETGVRCSSRAFLQKEHHRPHALGGRATIDNLSDLCAAHNALRAQQVFGAPMIQAIVASRTRAIRESGRLRQPEATS